MRRIETTADIAEGLKALTALDPELHPVIAIAGEVPLRRRPGGFEGLARIVVSQQLSVASAAAIWNRLETAVAPLQPAAFLAATDDALAACGLSRPKIKTLRGVADAAACGRLELDALAELPPEQAVAILTELPGIGPWTAEIYLMFCLGHADIFPAGDLALKNAVADAFQMAERPSTPALADHAARWSPWRAVAARLFWAYYRTRREGRETLPV